MSVETRLISSNQSWESEPKVFTGKDTLVAVLGRETPEATVDWLRFYQTTQGAEAALIVDLARRDGFAKALSVLAPDIPVVVLRSEDQVGDGIYEVLCRHLLSETSAVAFFEVSDLAVPNPNSSIFDQIRAAKGQATHFPGRACFPWRLRQGRPAPFGDHIAVRQGLDRNLIAWGVVPGSLPDDVIWTAKGPSNTRANTSELRFYRATGVAAPGTPIGKLVRKADLIEAPELLALVKTAFNATPIRLPSAAPIPPRPASQNVTVVTVMKNEGPFILDWIAHNRALGIGQHLVYTNDCQDGTDRLLDLLSEAGVIRRDNPCGKNGQVPQHAAFQAAEKEPSVQGADWLLTLDVDEYINIHVGEGRLSDLLAAAPDAHLLSMRWRLFGNADQQVFEDRPVTQQFTKAAPDVAPQPLQAWAFKTLYRNAGIARRIGVHRPKGLNAALRDVRWVNGAGRDIPANSWRNCWRDTTKNVGYDLVTLNHYAVRSADSFLIKRERGRANHVKNDLGATYWFRMNHNAVEDTSIQRRASATEDEKQRLLSLPGVAEAHEVAVDWHRDRIATLKTDPDMAQLYAQITAPRMEKLSRMATKFGPNVHYFGPDIVPDEIADRDPTGGFYFNGTPEIQRKIKELRDVRPDPSLLLGR